jgi:lipopolysaccharide/colanic/teichoic acid biosynthesis glycosyltransferase
VAAFCLLLVSLPLCALIGLVIWVESPGRPLLRQERVGFDQRRFTMWKFRTMKVGCSAKPEKRRDDERVTRVGRLLRRTSLDELPQLVNIIRGDMVFVGPRPETPSELAKYRRSDYVRFHAPPGLTGLWQVSGRSDLDLREKIDLDLEYIRRRSLTTDLQILARTPWVVLTGRGAY